MIKKSLHTFKEKYLQSFTYFYQRLRYRIFVRMGLSIGVGVLDGFGLAMFLPLLQLTDSASANGGEGLGKLDFLVDGMEGVGLELNLLNILMVMSGFFILKGGARYISSMYAVNLRQFFIKTMRVNLSNALSRMSYSSFVTSNAGRIQNTMSGEVDRMSHAYLHYFYAFEQVVMVGVYMLFAFFVDAQFALLICIGGGVSNLLYSRIYRATVAHSKKLTMDSNIYQGLILQFVSNFKYLKATGTIRRYNNKLLGSIRDIEENNRKLGKLGVIVGAVREPILIIIVSTVILVQINLLGGTLGTILISLLFFYRALFSLMQMQNAYNSFLAVSGSMDNMKSFEQELEAAKDKEGQGQIKPFSQAIELKNAHFHYGDTAILKSINLRVEKNQTIAFVGESGSGKTTLINVLTGLLPVGKGSMLIDGVDSRKLNISSFQDRIGYITQESVVFNDTIFNNVSFWGEPTKENKEKFKRALQQASIEAFVEELPEKEHTLLGNNGINLSGGQRQRISIARELFKGGDILVLDEATSALDSETEKAIQKGLEALQGKYTILVVAHRLSTIKNVDKIIVMDKGEVVEEGSFLELSLASDKFKKMTELQEV